ncbi:MAG: bifunctional [glutamate--ammonia ligase]-adenylyl-L-tyrosine phosphorylase/[glutamate--ammonia-ligase] adenylyltransferase [Gammaproteobacteria bacterium]
MTGSNRDSEFDALPDALRPQARARWQALAPRLSVHATNPWLALLPRVLGLSDFVAQALEREPELAQDLLASGDLDAPYDPAGIPARVERALANVTDDAELKRRLRALRRREWVRLAWRDLGGRATLAEVMATLSGFADAMMQQALALLTARAYAQHGTPRGADGAPMRLVVLALGKLGGQELNFSSDVDLIFCYPDDGEIAGARALSHHEFFLRLGQSLINALSESTADGFAFRVDMRLRPHGSSGPLAVSFDAMEHYYQTHGREWERYAFIKARACAGDIAAGEALLARLKPFVYRRYLDYGTLDAIRSMKAMVAAEVARKGMSDHIKLGAGGIREIEFIAQTLQLIRGGRDPALQQRSTLTTLTDLARAGQLQPDAVQALVAAYTFLRNTEHRLQMVADQQTHTLPTDEIGRARLAASLGFHNVAELDAALAAHRKHVHAQFNALLADAAPAPSANAWSAVDRDTAAPLLRQAGYAAPDEVWTLLAGLRASAALRALTTDGHARLDRLMPLVIAECGRAREPAATLARMVRLLEAIGRRTAYFALLAENPTALTQLVNLASASAFLATWIGQHPALLDELLDPRALYALPARETLAAELRARLDSIGVDDLEAQLNTLREFRNSHMLRVAATDLGPGLSPDEIGRQLTQLAEVLVTAALELAQAELIRRHGRPRTAAGAVPGFVVIGYGKLGGFELGYGSDLDMVFIYDDGAGQTDGARPLPNELYFARLGQRLIHFLTARTAAGILYEVDMRLRPSGRSGLLVTSVSAYRAYQTTKAWTWEHQALVRSRAIAGPADLRAQFDAIRQEVLTRARDPEALRAEVREMRERMRQQHADTGDMFDVKHSRGGIVDIEFMVQYWVLRWAHQHPAVARHTDNIHILQSLASAGAIDTDVANALTDAYRRCLGIEYRLKLMERGARIPRAGVAEVAERVAQWWQRTIETGVT